MIMKKKLELEKEVIAKLEEDKMAEIRGGNASSPACELSLEYISCIMICPTYEPYCK